MTCAKDTTQCQAIVCPGYYSKPKVPKEKGTLILLVEEIQIIRDPPMYVPPVHFKPLDGSTRPALILDMNGVLCVSWYLRGEKSTIPDLPDATEFRVVQEVNYKCRPC